MNIRPLSIVPGALVLALSLVGCSAETNPTSPEPSASAPERTPILSMPTSAEAKAATGVAVWEVYQAKTGYAVVGRDDARKVLHAMHVTVTKHPGSTKRFLVAEFRRGERIVVDDTGAVQKSSLHRESLLTWQHFARDLHAQQAEKMAYGCVGDFFYAVGGFITSIAACAAIAPGAVSGPLDSVLVAACVGAFIGGPVASEISSYEDCGWGTVHEDWDVDFTDDCTLGYFPCYGN